MISRFLEPSSDGCKPQTRFFRAANRSSPARTEPTDGAAPGMGGTGARAAARGETRGGPLPFAFSGRVRNCGSGAWGFGSIVGWIPADVSPWHYCRRMGWVQIFSWHTKPLVRRRPYVLGDDGRYHLPERWEAVGE